MAKIVFMGTPDFAVPTLQTLIETQTVVGVVTQPDRPAGRGQQLRPSPVKAAATAAGIPVYQPKSLRSPEAAAPLHAWAPDLIVVAAFGQILRPHVLDLPPHGCLNVHASLLPRWRGASPIQHALLTGDAETGITLMQMDPGLDTGPMFAQRAIPIRPRETAASLHDRLAALGGALLRDSLPAVLAGNIRPQPQDDTHATYAPMIKKEDGQLDWTETAVALDRRIRAMTPWPGAFTTWNGQHFKILAAHPADFAVPAGPPGQVLALETVADTGAETVAAVVLTGSGGLVLDQVQLAGKRAADTADFLRGRPDLPGSILGAT